MNYIVDRVQNEIVRWNMSRKKKNVGKQLTTSLVHKSRSIRVIVRQHWHKWNCEILRMKHENINIDGTFVLHLNSEWMRRNKMKSTRSSSVQRRISFRWITPLWHEHQHGQNDEWATLFIVLERKQIDLLRLDDTEMSNHVEQQTIESHSTQSNENLLNSYSHCQSSDKNVARQRRLIHVSCVIHDESSSYWIHRSIVSNMAVRVIDMKTITPVGTIRSKHRCYQYLGVNGQHYVRCRCRSIRTKNSRCMCVCVCVCV
jgi:hypothetical protein